MTADYKEGAGSAFFSHFQILRINILVGTSITGPGEEVPAHRLQKISQSQKNFSHLWIFGIEFRITGDHACLWRSPCSFWWEDISLSGSPAGNTGEFSASKMTELEEEQSLWNTEEWATRKRSLWWSAPVSSAMWETLKSVTTAAVRVRFLVMGSPLPAAKWWLKYISRSQCTRTLHITRWENRNPSQEPHTHHSKQKQN